MSSRSMGLGLLRLRFLDWVRSLLEPFTLFATCFISVDLCFESVVEDRFGFSCFESVVDFIFIEFLIGQSFK